MNGVVRVRARADGSLLGELTAAVFSADLTRAIDVATRLDVGGVVVNGTNP